ncbi:MAG TPA: peptidoglycan-binding protein [Actinomycetes bacterium]|nr:peptidoglycan-binding protein [Actinomycetes bacterium]
MSARVVRRLAVTAATGAVLAGAAWWTGARAGDQAGEQRSGSEVATATAAVARRDLRAQEQVDGTLGYGEARAVPNRREGTITALPREGAVVSRGKALYRVDGKPVQLLYGRLPAWRELALGVDDGPDVRQLEQNLVALGYDPDRAITVDHHFTSATRAAVRRWQKVIGLDQTGVVRPGDAVWQPGPVRVAKLKAGVGDLARPGSPLLEVTDTTRQVTIDLDASRQPYVRAGDRVDLELPGGGTTTGRVVSVGKVASVPSGDGTEAGGEDPTVELVVSLDKPKATGRLDQAPVDASITTEVRKGVLAVPVNALLALAEGGYAVEVERDGRRELVGVTTGLFADGQVEVEGGGLRAGDRVVVPA